MAEHTSTTRRAATELEPAALMEAARFYIDTSIGGLDRSKKLRKLDKLELRFSLQRNQLSDHFNVYPLHARAPAPRELDEVRAQRISMANAFLTAISKIRSDLSPGLR